MGFLEKSKARFLALGLVAAAPSTVEAGQNFYPKIVQRIQREGHAIGGHAYRHVDLRVEPTEKATSQIKETDRLLQSQLGFKPAFFWEKCVGRLIKWRRKALGT